MGSMTAPFDPAALPSGTGCAECEAAGGWWVHLRRCAAVLNHLDCIGLAQARQAFRQQRGAHAAQTLRTVAGGAWLGDHDVREIVGRE